MTVYKLTSKHFEFNNGKATIIHPKFQDKAGLVMIKAEWCGFCKKAKPEFEKAASAMGAASAFGYVDVDNSPKLVEKLGISSFPTIKSVKKEMFQGRDYSGQRTSSAFIDKILSLS